MPHGLGSRENPSEGREPLEVELRKEEASGAMEGEPVHLSVSSCALLEGMSVLGTVPAAEVFRK